MGKDGKRICKIDTHVCITESACFTLDTNTTLLKTILPILPNTKWKWKATTKLRQHYHLAPARLSSLFFPPLYLALWAQATLGCFQFSDMTYLFMAPSQGACAAFLCHLHLADTHPASQSPWCCFLRILLHPSQGHFLKVPTTCWTSSSTNLITCAIICSRSCSLQDYKRLDDRDCVCQVHYKISWLMHGRYARSSCRINFEMEIIMSTWQGGFDELMRQGCWKHLV